MGDICSKTMFQKVVVIDGRDHLLGRLSSIIAKELLNGQKIVVVRAEEINISGSLFRNKIRYWQFLRKKMNTNPNRGPFHERAPSKILQRTVRGMLPRTTARGRNALANLKVYEGVPPQYVAAKKVVVPQALRILRLNPSRKYAKLGVLSHEVGWSNKALIEKLEAKRKQKALGWYRKKKEALNLYAKAKAAATQKLSAEDSKTLSSQGY